MRISRIIIMIQLSISCLLATDPFEWSADAASVLEPGQRQIGLFQPWRIGMSDRYELSTHPLLFLGIPNLSVKLGHGSMSGLDIGSRHSMTYPTLLLKAAAKEGIGGLISPEFEIPAMLHHKSELLVSKPFGDRSLVNLKAGLAITFRSGDLDSRTSIDLPLLYQRWATWYSGWGVVTGGELIHRLSDKLAIQADGDIFLHSGDTGGLALEHKSLLHFARKSNRRFSFGYKLTYVEYPFGKQVHFLGPIFDFQWSWEK